MLLDMESLRLDYPTLRKHYTNIKWLSMQGKRNLSRLNSSFELQTTQALAVLELAKHVTLEDCESLDNN